MRFFLPFVLVCSTASVAACVHEDHRPTGPTSNELRTSPPPAAPIQYLIGDPGGGSAIAHIVPLHGGAQGIVVDKRRVIVARGETRMAADTTSEPIQGATKVPARFGGGFLFWTENSIYRAEAFDSALIPVGHTPDAIESISFGPKAMMVRTRNGERWGIGLPKGERVALLPLGLLDAVALDDGRALSFDDRGSVFMSLDNGVTWSDVTAQVKGTPTRVFMLGDELWLEESSPNAAANSAMRLEPDGHLAWFDAVPPDPVAEFRPHDPRWRGTDPPLRTAIRQGVAIDDQTALVIDSGDIFRIDVHTGDVVSVNPGKLPPDAMCQGMSIPGDVLFACAARSQNASTFVVSHTLSGEPVIEQTFVAGGQFYGSDDGGLAYGASCSAGGSPSNPMPAGIATVCIRMPTGQWEERDVSLLATDGGVGPSDVTVARWIPRSDGRVSALITEPTPGLYDPVSGSFLSIGEESRNLGGRGSPSYYPGKYPYPKRYGRRYGSGGSNGIIDGSWSFSGTSVHGAGATSGQSFEISEDGKVKQSPYDFEAVFSNAQGVGRSKDGRLYQTNDHGMTWTEVAAPPSGAESLDFQMCSSVGCDFGAFYRIGWQLRPPRVDPVTTPAAAAPSVRRVRGLELACHPNGPVVSKLLPRTEVSPEDLGLGAAVRLPTANEKNDWAYVRTALVRGIVAPQPSDSSDNGETLPALRALLTGFSADKDDNDTLVVHGPNKNIRALRRGISYVPPFDPMGRVVRTSFGMSDVIAAALRVGMQTDEILAADITTGGTPFPLTPVDPNAPSELALHDQSSGLLTLIRGERVRVAMRTNANSNNPQTFSGVVLPGDEVALLETEGGTQSRVYKVGANGITDLFDLAPASEGYHSANSDALAVGPKGELAVLRTPSGSDPASVFDPAYLVTPGAPPTQLAPWSTVKMADDPACKGEPGGYRATLEMIGPWIRLSTPNLKVDESAMTARVRWSEKRVCLEGFEVRLPNVTISVPSKVSGTPANAVIFQTWLVGKGSTLARVAVADGLEWRQPLECSVAGTGP